MSDVETRFHEEWLGLVQPTEGLVVSIPVLVDALCMARQPPEAQESLLSLTREEGDGRAIVDLASLFAELLGHPPSHFDAREAIPADVSLYVPEGGQTLRPTLALKRDPLSPSQSVRGEPVEPRPSTSSGRTVEYVALVWDLPTGLDLDKPETATGPWEYPPSAKLDRLLRHCRVPIGILTNRRAVRLVYAPHGESSGSVTFRVDHMASTSGRPILDAFVMLLHAKRFFSVASDRTLPALLAESRKRQANVTNDLAEQVLDAVQILLRGFEVAAERDGSPLLREAVEREDDHVYGGLLTVLMRLVFVLYAEDWALLPVTSRVWADHYSVLGLFAQLQADHGAYPDSMSRRFGAWSRLIALFRAVYLGVDYSGPDAGDDIHMPPRRGHLFDPGRFSFLEGWDDVGGAPIHDAAARAAVRVPSVDDETVFQVLHKLVIYRPPGSQHGQRLSYRALDVEQLGSVYEALMGYHVEPLEHDAVALKVKAKATAARAWVEVRALLEVAPAQRARWLEDTHGFDKASAKKVAEAVKDAPDVEPAAEALADLAAGKSADRRARCRAAMGRLVLQPGPERRRTSSHYTPRELSGPIVRRTLEPLLAVMGESPASERILNLKVCDPAMGSGAFLVEACRFLGDEVVAAWAREGQLPTGEDPTLAARRLVAQRCLYGVDKNAYAVDLAKLSLWLVTLAKDLPFTFLDHALRHGDSLVGLDFDQIRAGHWKPGKQLETAELTLREALDEAIQIRMDILELARDPSPEAQREKERKLGDADDALRHARLLADIVVGAFFAHEKDKDREKERQKRVDAFAAWKASGDIDVPEQLAQWQMQIRERLPVFHWMLEFPEVFYAERPDPLDENQVNRAAYMDAFVGNPPFAGGLTMSGHVGNAYLAWGKDVLGLRSVKADLAAYFLRRAGSLLGTHGAMGFLATNTIAQGDTRLAGLAELVRQGFVIYEAVRSMLWPGEAAVAVAVVHLARGSVSTSAGLIKRLDGAVTSSIDSFLSPRAERPAPLPLVANGNLAFQGVIAQGAGFVLEPEERDRLIAADARNDQVIFPYLGGAEVNTSPSQQFERYVISFGERPLGEAEQWPLVLDVLRQRVKPERDRLRDDQATARIAKERWWLFWAPRTERFADLRLRERCLVAARVTKHLCFSFQSTSRVFNEKLYVFPFDHLTPFAVLQSRIHDRWTWLLSSTMKNDLNYSASDCFETFPFPQPDPRAVIPHLEDVGQRLYDARAKYMIDEQVGLTITYNRLKDPTVTEARIVELRRLHEEMDAAVLGAYGWSDLVVPPFCIATDADKKALETFENEVIDRLFVLNAKRAEEERVLGAGAAKGAKGGKARGKGGNKKGGAGQGEIPL